MLKTTVGQLLINAGLPPALRDYQRKFDNKSLQAFLQQIAEQQPEQYRDIAQHLMRTGEDVAYNTGGFSFGIDDLKPAVATLEARRTLQGKLAQIRRQDRPAAEKSQAMVAAVMAAADQLEPVMMTEARGLKNPLANQIDSGARGNAKNLRSLLGFDGLYVDHHNQPIPLPVLKNYSEGVSPMEYWAGTFGARKSVIDTKLSTQRSGFVAKQFNQAAHRLVATETGLDPDNRNEQRIGMPVDTDDADNVGALLAYPVGGYARNTILTPKILRDLRQRGVPRLIVRTPITGGPATGGVYAADVGVRERRRLPPLGDYVGLAAAQALSEKLTQGALGSKHSAGVVGGAQAVTGFPLINQMIQVPKTFTGGATHAQLDGQVGGIRPAPQGGQYVTVDGVEHYVPQNMALQIKLGDHVEAGDVLSEGIPNPAEIVRHKGIGEGRRYFTQALRRAYQDAGMGANRRNIELLTTGLIDHVRMTDEYGEYVPDDVVPYSSLVKNWEPREDAEELEPTAAVGKYLERPVLHYSIGTKLRPSMVKELKAFGVPKLLAHPQPPPFEPEMQRAMTQLQHDPDLITRHLGSGLEKSTLTGVHRGGSSDASGTSFAPALALDPLHFGRKGQTRGWRA